MPYTVGTENKNNYSFTNEEKDDTLIWDDATMTWDEATRTWDSPGRPITKEQKNLDFLITEDNDFLLTEDGDYLELEQSRNRFTNETKT